MELRDPFSRDLEEAWSGNPFTSDRARAHSAYSGTHGGELVRLLEVAPVGIFARVAHAAFRAHVTDDHFSCLGARSALTRGTYRFGAYERLADPEVSEGLARDLYAFVRETAGFAGEYSTFIAVFRSAPNLGEDAEGSFESALWRQLAILHELDRPHSPWAPGVSADPENPRFCFSLASCAFFVVGLHPGSSRPSRRFAWPALVFNAHEQFESLRRRGQFERLRTQIRTREINSAGSLNPNLADYGLVSEARQYSGRPAEDAWQCPFRPR